MYAANQQTALCVSSWSNNERHYSKAKVTNGKMWVCVTSIFLFLCLVKYSIMWYCMSICDMFAGAAVATATCGGYLIITIGLLLAAACDELKGRKMVMSCSCIAHNTTYHVCTKYPPARIVSFNSCIIFLTSVSMRIWFTSTARFDCTSIYTFLVSPFL